MESIDYHQLPRRELQSLCKKHGIPANKKNSYMADALASLFKGNQSGQNCSGDALASTSDESDRVEQSEEEQPEDEVSSKEDNEVLKNHSSELIHKGEFETHGCNATATCNSGENQEEYHYCEADTSIPDQVVNKENILLTKTAGIHVESSDKTPSKKELETTKDLMKDISTDKLEQEAIGKSGIPVPSNSDADNKEVDLSGSLTNDESVITPSEAIKDDNSTDEFHQQAISNFGTQVTSKSDAVSNEVNLSVDEYTVSSSQAIKDAQIQEMSQASTLIKMGIENCSRDKEVVMSSHLTFDESSVSPSQPLKETQIKEKSQASSITRIEIANCFVEKALQLTDNLESPICKQQVVSGTANNESSFEGNIKESSSHDLEATDSKYLSDYTRKPSDSNTAKKGLQDAAEGREGRHITKNKSPFVGIEGKNVNNCPVSDPTEEFEDCLETSVEGHMDMDTDMDMCPEDTKQSFNNVTVPSQVEESTDMQTDNNVQKASFCHIKAFTGEEATRVDDSEKLYCSNLQADDNKDVTLNDQLPVENNNKEDNVKCCISDPIVDVDMLAADISSQGSEFQHSGPSTDELQEKPYQELGPVTEKSDCIATKSNFENTTATLTKVLSSAKCSMPLDTSQEKDVKFAVPQMMPDNSRLKRRTPLPMIPPRSARKGSSLLMSEIAKKIASPGIQNNQDKSKLFCMAGDTSQPKPDVNEMMETDIGSSLLGYPSMSQVGMRYHNGRDSACSYKTSHKQEASSITEEEIESPSLMQRLEDECLTPASRFMDNYKKSPFVKKSSAMQTFERASNLRGDILAKRRAVPLYQNENSQPISSNLIDGSNLNKNVGSQVTSNSSVNKDLKEHTAEISSRADIFSSRVAESQDFTFFKVHPEEHYPVPFMTPGPKMSNKLEDSGDNSQCKSVGVGERKQKLLTRFLKKALEESVERQRTKKMQSTEGEQSTPMQKPSAFGDISSILDSDNAGPEGFADPSKKRKDMFKTPIVGKSKAKSLETAKLMSLSNRAKLFNSRRGISSEDL